MTREAREGRAPIVRAKVSLLADDTVEVAWQYWLPNHKIGVHKVQIR
jgi:hypothetical protein